MEAQYKGHLCSLSEFELFVSNLSQSPREKCHIAFETAITAGAYVRRSR